MVLIKHLPKKSLWALKHNTKQLQCTLALNPNSNDTCRPMQQ